MRNAGNEEQNFGGMATGLRGFWRLRLNLGGDWVQASEEHPMKNPRTYGKAPLYVVVIHGGPRSRRRNGSGRA